jgi:hypothetical protein
MLAGMAIQPSSFRPLAFALVAATAIFGSAWWLRWPRQTVERFVGHLGSGQFERAAAMVAAPSALRAEGERLFVRTADGREVAVPRRGATLAALEAPGRPARAGLSSYLLASNGSRSRSGPRRRPAARPCAKCFAAPVAVASN